MLSRSVVSWSFVACRVKLGWRTERLGNDSGSCVAYAKMNAIIGKYWKRPAQAEIEVTSRGTALVMGIGRNQPPRRLQGRRPYDTDRPPSRISKQVVTFTSIPFETQDLLNPDVSPRSRSKVSGHRCICMQSGGWPTVRGCPAVPRCQVCQTSKANGHSCF